MEHMILYEAKIDAGDGTDRMLQLKIEMTLSAANMSTLYSNDDQASNQVIFGVAEMGRNHILNNRPGGLCQECKKKRATNVSASMVRLNRPAGGLEPPKVIDTAICCVCDDEKCVVRAVRKSRRELRLADRADWDPDDVTHVRACIKCGKEESKDGPRLVRCSLCLNAVYCGAKCQKADLKDHKFSCSKVARKKRSKK